MRAPILVTITLVVCVAAGLGFAFGTQFGPRSASTIFLSTKPAVASPLNTVMPVTPTGTSLPSSTPTPTASPTRIPLSPTPIPRATILVIYAPTVVAPIVTPSPVNPSVTTASATPVTTTSRPRPTDTRAPTFTPIPTATWTPTATPTPSYDFVVVELKKIPRPEHRDIALIRGRLIDQQGNLIPGAYFQIASDGTPQFVAVEPHGSIPADGTATFAVSKGRFAVRVLGGRSEYAGWMVTGTTGVGSMTDWEFTFQTTRPLPAGILVSPTSTPTQIVVPASR